MPNTITHVRFYFPSGLRWTLAILFAPLVPYLLIIGWYITALISLILVFALWSCKYVISVDQTHKQIRDEFFLFMIPFGKTNTYQALNHLIVTKENKSYRSASRARDYMVHYAEYSLHLKYDDHQQLTFFAMNDADVFNRQVKKLAQELNLGILHHE